MSIFSSYPTIGQTEDGKPDGSVLWYFSSTSYPSVPDAPEAVELASIPAWCVPGHADAEDSTDVGEFARLSLGDPDAAMDGGYDVILTEASARAIRDQLDHWLSIPKRKAISDA